MERDRDQTHVVLNGKRYVMSRGRMEKLRERARKRRVSIEEIWAEVLVSERL